MINIESVISYEFDDTLDEHLDVVLYRDLMVDNDKLDNHFYQEHVHMDSRLNILVGMSRYFVVVETLRYQLALNKDKIQSQ
jgi:cupin superfamily acireductone dioxygenase involved in methionine salvage